MNDIVSPEHWQRASQQRHNQQKQQRQSTRIVQRYHVDAAETNNYDDELSKLSLPERLMRAAVPVRSRELANNNNNGGNYNNNNGNYNNNRNSGSSSSSSSSTYKGLDLSAFAFKYVGCQNIHTWSDTAASNSDYSPLAMDRFVLFRLCPKNTCSDYNRWGCNSEYGEYMLPMEEYLEIFLNYHLAQMGTFCQVCSECMYEENNYSSDDKNKGDDKYNDDIYDDATKKYTDDDASTAQYNYNYKVGDDDVSGYNKYWGDGYSQNYKNSYYNDDNAKNQNQQAQNNNNQKNNNNNYDDLYADDVYDDGYGRQRRTSSNSGYLDADGKCVYSTVCSNYQKTCQKVDSDYSSNNAIQNFFSCTQFHIGNNVGYIAPHCRSDGRTIGIGFYAERNCDHFIGDVVDLSKYLQVDDAEFAAFYDKECVSCNAVEAYSLVTNKQLSHYTNYNSNISSSSSNSGYKGFNYPSSPVYPLCSALFDQGAKCHLHMSNSQSTYQVRAPRTNENRLSSLAFGFLASLTLSDTLTHVQTKEQAANQDRVCNLIGSLVENTYDENGEVILRGDFSLANWNKASEYSMVIQKASIFQIFLLTASVMLVVGLGTYSVYLRRKLHHRRPWTPPRIIGSHDRDDAFMEAGRISRLNSGIMEMRTASSVEGGSSQTGGLHAKVVLRGNYYCTKPLVDVPPAPSTYNHASRITGPGYDEDGPSYSQGAFA